MKKSLSKLEITFAKKLKQARGEESQVKFSKRIGIAQSTLNRIENGEQSVTLHLVERIANRLKIDVFQLLR